MQRAARGSKPRAFATGSSRERSAFATTAASDTPRSSRQPRVTGRRARLGQRSRRHSAHCSCARSPSSRGPLPRESTVKVRKQPGGISKRERILERIRIEVARANPAIRSRERANYAKSFGVEQLRSFNRQICIPSEVNEPRICRQAENTQRVTFNVPTDAWVVISEVVVVLPGLLVEVLAGESEVVGNCRRPRRTHIHRRGSKPMPLGESMIPPEFQGPDAISTPWP